MSAAPGVHAPVLIVDDNPAKRLALRAVLLPLGYAIVEAESGVAALRAVLAQDFAVILLDVRMPVMDGFETAAIIRRRRQSEMTPIIFITAYGSDEMVSTDHFAEGAVDFMFAPVPPDELRAKVSVFANLFIKAEALATRAREVQISADRLRLLTDAAPIGIFRTDAEDRYVYTNPRWSEITGIPSPDAVGLAWDTIFDPEQRAELRAETVDAAPRGELSQRVELKLPGSEPRFVLVTSKVMLDHDGCVAGWVGTLADVTAEVGAETAMSDARDQATQASRLKSDFLANMSHEIRTPMNGVIGMTDLLLETDLDARQRDYAQTVRNSGEALLAIINDILDFSKVELGQLDIEEIDFDVRAIVDDVVTLLGGAARGKDLELMAVTDGSVPAMVSGDPGRVRQVLTNLVGNAIKFTQSGGIVVRISQAADEGTGALVRFEVTDTGDGIAEDKLAVIFQPFIQADTSTSRKYGGTGLGLSISSQLVALMGGDCGVSSEPGVGSTFWFTVLVHAQTVRRPLPQQMSDLEPAGPGLEEVVADEPVGGYLLLAEDNLVNQKVAVAMLSGAGYRVDAVLNGAAAVDAAASRPYDTILMDLQMPVLNGYQATAAIRALDGARAHVPIIALTAGARREDRERALAEGMDSYLAKPVSKEALLALVGRSVREGAARRAAAARVEDTSAGEITIDPAVLDELRDIAANAEPDLLAELVEHFVRETEPRLDQLRDAVQSGDALAVVRIAHSIKGSCAQLGGRRLALSCARLERNATASGLSDTLIDLRAVDMDYQELRQTLLQLSSELRERPSGFGA